MDNNAMIDELRKAYVRGCHRHDNEVYCLAEAKAAYPKKQLRVAVDADGDSWRFNEGVLEWNLAQTNTWERWDGPIREAWRAAVAIVLANPMATSND